MYITKERFDLLYRVYMVAQKVYSIPTDLSEAIEALKDHEIKAVTEQLMNGENNRTRPSTIEDIGVQHDYLRKA